jgi:type 1 fimbria pilin
MPARWRQPLKRIDRSIDGSRAFASRKTFSSTGQARSANSLTHYLRILFMTKKFLIAPIAAALLAGGVAHAQAVNPSSLTVQGTITVPSCTVIQPNNDGVYDFGEVASSSLSTNRLPLNPLSQTWTVDCGSSDTYMTYTATDNDAASVLDASAVNYGLGFNGANKIGFYTVTMENGLVDGNPTSVYWQSIGSPSPGSAAATTPVYNVSYKHGWVHANGTAALGKIFEMDLKVAPTLGTLAEVGSIAADVPFAGTTTLIFTAGI